MIRSTFPSNRSRLMLETNSGALASCGVSGAGTGPRSRSRTSARVPSLQRRTARGRNPRNDQRPTWPCSADSSRNAGPPPRSFRKAETGVSQSSTKRSRTGTTFPSTASSRAVSRSGSRRRGSISAATLIEDLHHLGLADAARDQQHAEVVEHIRSLLGDALAALLAGRARYLL